MDYYAHHLNVIGKKYPDIFLKLVDKPKSVIQGHLNDLLSSKIDLNDEEAVRGFFRSHLALEKYIDFSSI